MAAPSFRTIWLAALAIAACLVGALPARAETRSTGTAFVVHSEGLLLTCFHVVKDAGRIDVRLDGKVYRALVVGTDPARDLALLQVDATSLPALPWVKAEDVELGEEVRAFGFPLTAALGSSLKVTRGTVSGVEREEGQPVFQIDSAVNPGNSGGPLVNDRGEVVGVVVARFADAMGVGYVMPADAATPLLRGLAPLRPGEKRVRFEGPALVHRVSPSVALVTCVPLEETGKLPAPFKREFPKLASSLPPPPVAMPAVAEAPVPVKPLEKPEIEKPAVEKPPVEKPAAPAPVKPVAEAPVKPTPEAPAPAKPAVEPVAKVETPAKPPAEPAAKPESPTPVTQPLAATAKPAAPAVKPEAAASTGKPDASTVPKPAAPAPVKPESAPKPETAPVPPKPAPPVPEKPAIDVDAELCKIRNADPPEFPQPLAQAVVPDATRAEWTITNATDAVLTILIRGEEKRVITVEPKKTVTVMLVPGKYEVAGKLAVDYISPFYGNQEFTKGGRYQSRFRIELQ